ncbi:hypothetical protein [Streptomyces dioscori]|uniref:hypothetical protein n=1 Tax=Streptomyces dioscori TaxID=2109333 RepID=UPI00131B8B32|nr:hypothetical protein [Streptomyces dioscori]
MSSTVEYRLRGSRSQGGLAADLTAEHRSPGTGDGSCLQIHRNVSLALPGGTHWRDAAWLAFGLSVHSADLSSAHPDGLLVEVAALTFPLAHYRPEVAALVMDAWLRNEFALPDQGLRAARDEEKGEWGFQWGGHPDPFSGGP